MIKAHIITGQTATGKTHHAIALAQEIGGYLISADSRQIYSGMNIITGKDVYPSDFFTLVETVTLTSGREVMLGFYTHENVQIWGYDCISPDTQFSAYEFACLFQKIISLTIVKNITPIVVGGSYLYIKALLDGLDTMTAPSWELRNSLETTSISQLQESLQKVDKKAFDVLNNSDRNNPHRLIRKIEIASAKKSGQSETLPPLVQPLSYVGFMHPSQEALQMAISQRIEGRVQAGALEEVKKLLDDGYTADSPGIRTLGYKDLMRYITGDISWNEAVEKWLVSEIQYAKRQKTFMKKDLRITWQMAK